MQVKPGKYFAYCCEPIDWWAGWLSPVEAVAESLKDGWDALPSNAFRNAEILAGEIDRLIKVASAFLLQHGWEGDIRGPNGTWMVSVVPDAEINSSVLVFAVKQDNNGTTFVVSPYELPWLTKNGTLQGTFNLSTQ
jgi:hypothetical protein